MLKPHLQKSLSCFLSVALGPICCPDPVVTLWGQMASPAGKTPVYQVHAPAPSPESWLNLLVTLANTIHTGSVICFHQAPGSPNPERLLEGEVEGRLRRAKSVKTGSHGKPAKTQPRSQGSSWEGTGRSHKQVAPAGPRPRGKAQWFSHLFTKTFVEHLEMSAFSMADTSDHHVKGQVPNSPRSFITGSTVTSHEPPKASHTDRRLTSRHILRAFTESETGRLMI